MLRRLFALAALLMTGAGLAVAEITPTEVTFDDRQYEGWTILGFQDPVWRAEGGNPGAHLNFFYDNFYIDVYNESSATFIGDYTQKGPLLITGDLRWRTIRFGNVDVTRDLFFAIWDEYFDDVGNRKVHVLLRPLGKVRGQGAHAPWRTHRIRIPNPTAAALPGGWLYWDFDAANEPTRTLPAGLTWRDILSSVDRVQWTTATPGLFFGFTVFDVSFDNAGIQPLAGTNGMQEETADAIDLIGLDVAGENGPDGVVDERDIERFREWHAAGSARADITTTGALSGDWNYGLSDGLVDLDDLLVFEAAWTDGLEERPR